MYRVSALSGEADSWVTTRRCLTSGRCVDAAGLLSHSWYSLLSISADSRRMMCRLCTFQSTHQLGPAHPLTLPRLRSILIHQLRLLRPSSPHQLMPATTRGVTLPPQQRRRRANNLALPPALHNLEPAPRPLRFCLQRHLCLVSLQYQLRISTTSLTNICVRHRP